MPEQRITGEALYALLLSAHRELAYTWRDLPPYDKDVYTEVAVALNGTYLAPLQKQSGSALTGEDVAACLGLKWERFCSSSQQLYIEIAEKINQSYINPLQGLVRDWQELVQAHDEMSVMSLTKIEGWNQDWEELKKRTRQLLTGEQKVKE